MTCEEFRTLCRQLRSPSEESFRLSRLTAAYSLNVVVDPLTQIAFVELDDGVASVPITLRSLQRDLDPWVERPDEYLVTEAPDVQADLERALRKCSTQMEALVACLRRVHRSELPPGYQWLYSSAEPSDREPDRERPQGS